MADPQKSDVTLQNRKGGISQQKLERTKLCCETQCKTELNLHKISRIPPDMWENWQNLTQPEARHHSLWDAIAGDS